MKDGKRSNENNEEKEGFDWDLHVDGSIDAESPIKTPEGEINSEQQEGEIETDHLSSEDSISHEKLEEGDNNDSSITEYVHSLDRGENSPTDVTNESADSDDNENTTLTSTTEGNEGSENNGDNGDEKGADEEYIPEMHDDVYRRPLQGYDVTNPSELAEAVGAIDKQAMMTIEELARQNKTLKARVERLNEELSEKEQEFQEFRKRKNKEMAKVKRTASSGLLRRLIPIRDNLERALLQDDSDIKKGVKMIREQFDELLENEGVTIIKPNKGDELDPKVHEVMATVESTVEDDHIYQCFRPGYKVGDRVLQTARVTISEEVEEPPDQEEPELEGEEKEQKPSEERTEEGEEKEQKPSGESAEEPELEGEEKGKGEEMDGQDEQAPERRIDKEEIQQRVETAVDAANKLTEHTKSQAEDTSETEKDLINSDETAKEKKINEQTDSSDSEPEDGEKPPQVEHQHEKSNLTNPSKIGPTDDIRQIIDDPVFDQATDDGDREQKAPSNDRKDLEEALSDSTDSSEVEEGEHDEQEQDYDLF